MADIQIGVNQGDIVYYFDQSVGSVVSRDWFFPGGTPTGGTTYGPSITYNSVNSIGYNASLLVTDAAGVTAGVSKSNIIVVYPEIANPSISTTSPPIIMSNVTNYLVTGSTGSGFVSYLWNIPGIGVTSGSSLSSVNYQYQDWYELSGTYTGLPGSTYVGPVTLTVTTSVGNTFNANTTTTYYKYGPVEEINYNETAFPYGVAGPYYQVTVLGPKTNSIGLGGSNPVIKIDQSYYGGVTWNNSAFHSTTENCYFWPNSEDLNDTGYLTSTFTPIQFKTIFSGAALTLAGATYLADNAIDLGNYIKPGYISSNFNDIFYITDYPAGGAINTAKDGGRKWSNDAIEAYLSNKYYLSNSSKYIENGGFSTGTTPFFNLATLDYRLSFGWTDLNGGYGTDSHGPCVPTSELIRALGSNGKTVDATVEVYYEQDPTPYRYDVTLSAPGGTGNSPDTYLTSVQSNSRGKGIAQILNEATGGIGSPTRLSNFITFESAAHYASYQGTALYNSSVFEGLRISIINPFVQNTGTILDSKYIKSITLKWGPQWTTYIQGQGLFPRDRALGCSTSNPQSMISWLGIKETMQIPTDSHDSYLRGWRIGGI